MALFYREGGRGNGGVKNDSSISSERSASATQSTGASDACGSAHLALGHLDLSTTWPRFRKG